MKRRIGHRGLSLLLTLVLAVVSLSGCGSKSGKNKSKAMTDLDADIIYQETASPLQDIIKTAESGSEDDAPDSIGDGRLNFVSTSTTGGKYYVLYSVIGSENSYTLCVFDENGKDEQIIPLPAREDTNILSFCASPDGGIFIVTSRFDAEQSTFIPELKKLSLEKGEVKEVWAKDINAGEDFEALGMLSTDTGILIQSRTEIRVFSDNDGEQTTTLTPPEDFYGNLCMTPSGAVILVGFSSGKAETYKVDVKNGKIEAYKVRLPDNYDLDVYASGCGQYDFYAAGGNRVWGYKLDGSEPVVVLDCLASNIETESISGFAVLTTGTMVILYYNMEYGMEAGLFKKADPDQLGKKKNLSLACSYSDTELRKVILDFNKTNEKYRILLKEYPYDTQGNNTLNMEIASGNMPDMLYVTADMPVESYAAKGLFEDLDPYFSKDKEISEKEYLDNIIDALRIDGRMYFISPSFYVIGMLGKKKDFGETKGVTTGQIEKMISERNLRYDSALGIASRDSMLSWIMYCAMEEYVDWDRGTCSFNSESFINLLKFCAKFPKKINFERIDWDQYDTGMREGRQLLRDGFIGNFESYMTERYGYIGEELVFMGYPGSGENGPAVQNELAIAICSTTSDPEGCWEFLRTFYLDDYQERDCNYFPISKKALQKLADRAMNPPVHTYVDIDGNEVTEPETTAFFLNEQQVKIPVPTQEDVDKVLKMLESVDVKASVDSKISEIVNEEAGAYFAGQKSAEETADIIQRRVRVYISETK